MGFEQVEIPFGGPLVVERDGLPTIVPANDARYAQALASVGGGGDGGAGVQTSPLIEAITVTDRISVGLPLIDRILRRFGLMRIGL